MATIHLSSTGSNTAPYDTWAKAATTITTAVGALAAGDTLVASSTDTITAGGITISFPGTINNPNKFLSGVPGATSGLTSVVPGFQLVSSAVSYTVGGIFYANGINFKSDAGTPSAEIGIGASAGSIVTADACLFTMNSSGSSSQILFGNATLRGGGAVTLNSPIFKISSVGTRIFYQSVVRISNISFDATSVTPGAVFNTSFSIRAGNLMVDGGDFSIFGTGLYLHGPGQGGSTAVFRGIKLPAGWIGGPVDRSSLNPGQRVEVWKSGNGVTKYDAWVEDYLYTLKDENVIVMNGGANDGAATKSWKITTSPNCVYPNNVVRVSDMLINQSTTGTSTTYSVEIVNDGTTLDNSQVWYELSAYNVLNENKINIVSSSVPSVLATPTSWPTSSSTWVTTGLSSPVRQTISVGFTPHQLGYNPGRLCVATPNKTIYLNYRPSIT